MVPGVGMDPGEYCTWGFCNLTVNSGMCIGPVRRTLANVDRFSKKIHLRTQQRSAMN